MEYLSIIIPVFQQDQRYLNECLKYYNELPTYCKRWLKFIIIDDCSPEPVVLPNVGLNLSLYRIIDDIMWNIPGARNLGAMVADSENLLFIDLDHRIHRASIERLLSIKFDDNQIIKFIRFKDDMRIHPHPATLLMKKKMFLKLNGCDEDFSGHYGSDGHLRACIKEFGCEIINSNIRIDTYSKTDGEAQHNLVRDLNHNKLIMENKNVSPIKKHSKKCCDFIGVLFPRRHMNNEKQACYIFCFSR